jgi:predicted SnoaL-like aldol condensation-catalyzing enzyme
MRIALLALSLLLTAGPATAADPMDTANTAKGTFKSQNDTLELRSALAFRGKSIFEKDDALIVAVTNARVNAAALAEYYDRRLAIEKGVKDAETAVVYFEFRPDGRYRGLSYYFGPGNGCGYCSGEVASTVRLVNGRLTGSLKDNEKNRSFDIALDVPVMSDEHGAPLPADGGAPGKAYLSYHDALVKRNQAALRPLLTGNQQEIWARAEKKGNVAAFINSLAEEHPNKSVRITRGFAAGDKAVLLITGEAQYGKLSGQVLLKKEKDAWRVQDEMTEMTSQ